MQPGSGNPGVAMGSTHTFSLMNFFGPVPFPSEALTCHSMWDVCDHHLLCLCLDARVWILHLHHKCFNLQSMAGMGCITGVDRKEPQDHHSSGQHPREVCSGVPQEWMQWSQSCPNLRLPLEMPPPNHVSSHTDSQCHSLLQKNMHSHG